MPGVLACFIALSLVIGCDSDSDEAGGPDAVHPEADSGGPNAADTAKNSGKLTLLITDKPVEEEITQINVRISQVMAQRAEVNEEALDPAPEDILAEEVQPEDDVAANDSDSWITIPTGDAPREFNLLALRDVEALLGEVNLPPGRYTQIRLMVEVSDVVALDNDGQETRYPLKRVGGGKLKLVRSFEIVEGEETSLLLDFDAEKGLTRRGKGDYLLKPVIKLVKEERKPVTQ